MMACVLQLGICTLAAILSYRKCQLTVNPSISLKSILASFENMVGMYSASNVVVG
jgi:hypothetical protein